MRNDAPMWRAQEAHHLQIAAGTALPNVRRVALAAARAWEVQALEAESRDAGSQDGLSDEDAAIVLEFRLEDDVDRPGAQDPSAAADDLKHTAIPPRSRNEEETP